MARFFYSQDRGGTWTLQTSFSVSASALPVMTATSNYIYIAYFTSSGGNKIFLCRAAIGSMGAAWDFQKQVVSLTTAPSSEMAIAASGQNVVVAYDTGSTMKVVMSTTAGSSVTNTTVSNAGTNPLRPSLAIRDSDYHIAFQASDGLRYAHASVGAGLCTANLVATGGYFASLALDPATTDVSIAYVNANAVMIANSANDGVTWTLGGTGKTTIASQRVSLAWNSACAPARRSIAYYNSTTADIGIAYSYDGTSWLEGDYVVPVDGQPVLHIWSSCMQINEAGLGSNLYLLYLDNSNLKARFARVNFGF